MAGCKTNCYITMQGLRNLPMNRVKLGFASRSETDWHSDETI